MPIPQRKVPINLLDDTPKQVTVDSLKQQLTEIGLTCSASAEPFLGDYIEDVRHQIPSGSIQTFAILKPGENPSNQADLRFRSGLVPASSGNWKPGDFGYDSDLEYIQFEEHFNWLMKNRSSFAGVVDNPPAYISRDSAVEAIKRLFVDVAQRTSSIVVKGLNPGSIESILSNVIRPLDKTQLNHYDVSDSRVIFLVENYDPERREADAIGVLTISWRLQIRDYKKKKGPLQHDTRLEISSRAVLYDSIDTLNADLLAAKAHFKGHAFNRNTAVPIKPGSVTIFPQRPPETKETFLASLPTKTTTKEAQVIVLYAPNLENIGCIDNSNSAASTSYSKSVTSGFTFTTAQTLTVEANFEASTEVFKCGLTLGISLTFTEEWSTSTTETMTFEVPPGKKAFTYQGYLIAQLLIYDPASDRYSYGKAARLMTDALFTSDKPLVEGT